MCYSALLCVAVMCFVSVLSGHCISIFGASHESCCSVLQCVAVCCSVLQCVAVCASAL